MASPERQHVMTYIDRFVELLRSGKSDGEIVQTLYSEYGIPAAATEKALAEARKGGEE